MIVKLLTEYHLEFLSLKDGCRGSSESTLIKMSHCWKSHDVAHIFSLVSVTIYLYDLLCVKKLSTFIQAYTFSSLLVCRSKEAVLQLCSIVSPLNTDFSISI